MKEIKNLYTITALAWKRDGSKLTAVSARPCACFTDHCFRRVRNVSLYVSLKPDSLLSRKTKQTFQDIFTSENCSKYQFQVSK